MKKYRLKIERASLNALTKKINLSLYPNRGEYVLRHYKEKNIELIIYLNSKNEPYKGVFTGEQLPTYLLPFLVDDTKEESKDPSQKITNFPHIGSDEVGFGDFFGPLVVVSAYLDKDIKAKISHLSIMDSKKIDDNTIILLGNTLKELVPHVKNIVSNPKFNELINEGYNMNHMKAMLHHNVLGKLALKMGYKGPLYIDKFTSQERYFEYTKNMPPAPIILLNKGEDNSLSIASASILARYYFLEEMAKLNKRFKTIIPLGAGPKVDEFARRFLKENGPTNLKAITKHNFRNFKDLF